MLLGFRAVIEVVCIHSPARPARKISDRLFFIVRLERWVWLCVQVRAARLGGPGLVPMSPAAGVAVGWSGAPARKDKKCRDKRHGSCFDNTFCE